MDGSEKNCVASESPGLDIRQATGKDNIGVLFETFCLVHLIIAWVLLYLKRAASKERASGMKRP
jgi:hypothetical protein